MQIADRLELLIEESSLTLVLESLADVCRSRVEKAAGRFGEAGMDIQRRWDRSSKILDDARSKIEGLSVRFRESAA